MMVTVNLSGPELPAAGCCDPPLANSSAPDNKHTANTNNFFILFLQKLLLGKNTFIIINPDIQNWQDLICETGFFPGFSELKNSCVVDVLEF